MGADWVASATGSTAATPPGAADSATITGGQGSYVLVGGTGQVASLNLIGNVDLTGGVTAASTSLGTSSAPSSLEVDAGASLRGTELTAVNGSVVVSGAGATLAISDLLTLGGGMSGVGLPVTSLSATEQGVVSVGGLIMGGGSGASVSVDSISSIEVGTLGNAAAGVVTIDAGAFLQGSGNVQSTGAIVDNGSLVANGGTLTLGTITGTGTLSVTSYSAAMLDGPVAAGITVDMTGTNTTLALLDERTLPAGTITGFSMGDQILLPNDTITSTRYVASTTGGAGTLTLLYSGQVAATLLMAGNFSGYTFSNVRSGTNGTAIVLTSLA
ncbi:MAG: hypothetical protein ACRYG6_13640, partial [Janthinobacterium lividum]